MDQKEFDQLLERYLHGNVSEAEKALIDRWYDTISPSVNSISSSEAVEIKARLQIVLNANKVKTKSSREVHPPLYNAWTKFALPIAACVIFTAIISLLFVTNSFDHRADKSGWVALRKEGDWRKVVNSTSSHQFIALDDESEITLAPGCVLEYPLRFDKQKREVRLNRGSAFFEIHKDANRPFYVYASGLVTKVLGTSFCINAGEHGRVRVDVKTGTVMVSRLSAEIQQAEREEVILRPNQRADYDPKRQTLVRTFVERPRIVIPLHEVENMIFEKAPVASILEAVEKAYEVEIRFDRVKLSSCVLTTQLIPDEDLYTRLRIICEAIDATYRLADGYILIIGKGC